MKTQPTAALKQTQPYQGQSQISSLDFFFLIFDKLLELISFLQARKQSEHDAAKVKVPTKPGTRLTRSQSDARRANSPGTRSSSKNGRARTGAVRWEMREIKLYIDITN